MLKFVIALLVAAAEIGAAAFVLRKVFGHAALRDSVMHGLYAVSYTHLDVYKRQQ